MRSSVLAVTVLAAVGAAVAAPGAARADDAAAKAAFLEGERAFELGKFEEAIAAYERAFSLDPQPAFVFNIALAHRRQYELDGKLEHLLRARELYRNYLRLDPASPRRAGVEKILLELGAKIDAARAQPGPPAPAAATPPPPAAARPGPAPSLLEARPAPSEPRESHAVWWVVGGAALVAAAAITVLLVAAHDRGPSFDGPPVDLRPR
jgi:tetratricopeptide (TPR) repeat protein